ncbi:MAG TPA: hypothetical protein DD979_09955 [Gammaproteobacteria bacterium]|jgi:transcriptional regulator with XRE-family HTH domain|nr:hypothetical protein [Gammaproteobacteria bacterium]
MNDASRLIAVRKSLGLNQGQFADAIGCARSLMSEAENGKRPVGRGIICGIALKYPEVDLRWLLTGKAAPARASIKSHEVTELVNRHAQMLIDELLGLTK